jgi:hypothetical protein
MPSRRTLKRSETAAPTSDTLPLPSRPVATPQNVILMIAGSSRAILGTALILPKVGEWLSLVEHLVRDQGVGGSNPLSPTNYFNQCTHTRDILPCGFFRTFHPKSSSFTFLGRRDGR